MLHLSVVTALVLACPVVTAVLRPNVIIILTDDQGYGDLGCHGNPYIRTPALDRLYHESVRLTDFHVDPTCSPTRAALLAGRYSTRVGVWLTYGGRHRLRADELTMADIFKANGYCTAIFGKWHLGDNYPYRPQDRGFQESLIHGGGVVGETPDWWGNDYYDDVYFRNGEPEKVSGYCTDVWFSEAIRFIEHNRSRPFFVYLPTNAAHAPHHVPRKYLEPYLRQGLRENVARFYGMISCIDENIARLRSKLRELKLEQNTILIFMTDNGGTAGTAVYNAGMRGRKATVYEGGHRAACFWYWPKGGLSGGRDVRALTAHIDILPTLVEFCRLKLPRKVAFDGQSLVPLLQGKTSQLERTLFVHHQGRFGQPIKDDRPIKYKDFCVLTPRWRLVASGRDQYELYDILRDPGQKENLAAQYPDVVEQLLAEYEHWWADVTQRADEYCPVVVGSPHQRRVVLTSQQWHGELIPYSQQHVRTGMRANGFWDIIVARPGKYRFTLRRWPEELNLPIRATVPPPKLDPKYHATSRMFTAPSRAIKAVRACLKVGNKQATDTVNKDDCAAVFEMELPRGFTCVQACFEEDNGQTVGAYYVYIEPVQANQEGKE